jgi:WD40 repeat protein
VKIWSVTTGVQLATLKGHTDVVWHVECFVSLSNETEISLVTAGRDATARTWAVPISRANANANGESTPPGNGPGTDNGNFKRPDTSAPVTLTPKSTLRGHGDSVLGLAAWEPCRGNKGTIKGTNAALVHFARTKNTITDEPEPPLLATCGADGVVVVWRVADGQIVSTLAGHKNGVLCAQFVDWSGDLSKQNPRIVTGSADHAVRVWCVFSGVCLGVMWDHGAPVTSIFARADALVTLAPGDGLMAYWRRVDCEDETNNSGSTPCFAGPITQDTQTLLDSNQEPPGTTPKTRLPENLHPAMTLMDGAGSGFCACFALDKDVLAMGTKTGTVQVLDFRRNARGARRERGEMTR